MHGSFSGTALHGMLFIEKRSGRAVSLFNPTASGNVKIVRGEAGAKD